MLYDAILPILASFFFLIGIGSLVLLMLRIIRDIKSDNRNRNKSLIPAWRIDLKRMLVIVMAVALIAIGNLTFWVNTQLRLYTPVLPGLPLGTITVMQKSESLPRLVYSSIDREGREALEVFPVREAGFRLVGERIRWSPLFRHLGLGEHFKLSRIEFYPMQTDPHRNRPTASMSARDHRRSSSGSVNTTAGCRSCRWIQCRHRSGMRTPSIRAISTSVRIA